MKGSVQVAQVCNVTDVCVALENGVFSCLCWKQEQLRDVNKSRWLSFTMEGLQYGQSVTPYHDINDCLKERFGKLYLSNV